jgi:hypothetical protein
VVPATDLYTPYCCNREALGDAHPDTIVTTYNLAELHSALGEEGAAKRLQEQLVRVHEQKQQSWEGPATARPTAQETESAGLGGGTLKVHKQVNSLRGAEAETTAAPTATQAKSTAKDATANNSMTAEQREKAAEEVAKAKRLAQPATRRKPQSPAAQALKAK